MVDLPEGFESREGNDALVTGDDFHEPETDDWWEHETFWFWFFHPERRLGCWSYHYVRPNIGVAGGGVFVWDDTAWFHMETPYYINYTNSPLPVPLDLRDVTFSSGQRIRVIDPMRHYRLEFRDRDTISFDLDWIAIMPPWVRVSGHDMMVTDDAGAGERKPRHFDQFGHVTGTFVLHGEELEIDCLAMRDRSWWHRRAEPWKRNGGRSEYITGAATPDHGFFGAGPGGFVVLDGRRRALVRGTKRRARDPEHGFVRRVVIDAVDTEGRELHVEGDSVSRMAIPISGVHGVCWQSLMRWEINGVEGWGDDQDAWPIHQWSAFRRSQMGLADARAGTVGDVWS
jgi:hypothetical protein